MINSDIIISYRCDKKYEIMSNSNKVISTGSYEEWFGGGVGVVALANVICYICGHVGPVHIPL